MKLAVFYPLNVAGPPAGQVVVALLVLTGISALAWRARKQHPYLPIGWLWYLVMLVPVIGIVQVGSQAHADRYTYLPLIGVFLALAWGAADVTRALRVPQPVRALSAGVVLTTLMAIAWWQTSYWRSSQALWQHTLASTSHNSLAHHLLGGLLRAEGRLDEAASHFAEALRIKPDFTFAHTARGSVLKRLGRYEEARAHFERALALAPDSAEAQNNLAWFCATVPVDELRDGVRAVALAESAARSTGYANALVIDTLAAAHAAALDFAEAVRWQERAIDLAAESDKPALQLRLELYRSRQPFRDAP
jgi:tetratricopeptide (TPR) repeat protein